MSHGLTRTQPLAAIAGGAADPRGLARAFAFGAIAGSILDGFHTHGGATAYPNPVFLRMAWWTPPLFGAAFTILAITYATARGDSPTRWRAGRVLGGLAVFAVLYFASGFLPASNGVKLALLVAGSVGLYAWADRSRAALVAGLVAAVVGPSFEVFLVGIGAFSHLQPDFAGIPAWLPGLYLASGPGLAPAAVAVLGGRNR